MLSFRERQINSVGYPESVLSVIQQPLEVAVRDAEAYGYNSASLTRDRNKRLAKWGINAYHQMPVELERTLAPFSAELRCDHDQYSVLVKDPIFPTPFYLMPLRGKMGRNCMLMNPMGPCQENNVKKNAYLLDHRTVWGDDKPPIFEDDYPILWLISEIIKDEDACIHLLLAWHMNKRRDRFDYLERSTFHYYSVVGQGVKVNKPVEEVKEAEDFDFELKKKTG